MFLLQLNFNPNLHNPLMLVNILCECAYMRFLGEGHVF